MKFILEIELGNDAMRTNRHIAQALEAVSNQIRDTRPVGKKSDTRVRIKDGNGNTVGNWALVEND